MSIADSYRFDFQATKPGEFRVVGTDERRDRSLLFTALCNDHGLLRGNRYDPVAEDLLNLALAIQVADRVANRQLPYPCHIHVSLEVRSAQVFEDSKAALAELLLWFTGDYWTFDFPSRPPDPIARPSIVMSETSDTPAALWSGGLDSLAGLVSLVRSQQVSKIVLVCLTADTRVKGLVARVFKALRANYAIQGLELRRLFIKTCYRTAQRESGWASPNMMPRSRGLVFMLAASAVALIEDHQSIQVFENGIGAINLPYSGGNYRDHSRAVHPLSLLKVQHYIKQLTGKAIPIQNQMMLHTKGEICQTATNSIPTELLLATISCDRRPRVAGQPKHCGWCSSCLMRRSAFRASGIEGEERYMEYSIASKSSKPHVVAMGIQVRRIARALDQRDPWHALRAAFPEIDEATRAIAITSNRPYDVVAPDVVRLYKQYVHEWNDTETVLQRELPPELMARLQLAWP